jgi:hypothetical protein
MVKGKFDHRSRTPWRCYVLQDKEQIVCVEAGNERATIMKGTTFDRETAYNVFVSRGVDDKTSILERFDSQKWWWRHLCKEVSRNIFMITAYTHIMLDLGCHSQMLYRKNRNKSHDQKFDELCAFCKAGGHHKSRYRRFCSHYDV